MRSTFPLGLIIFSACSSFRLADMTGPEAQYRYYENHQVRGGKPPNVIPGGGRLVLELFHTELNSHVTHMVNSEWMRVELNTSTLFGSFVAPSSQVRVFGGRGGGILGSMPPFILEHAKGSIRLLGKEGHALRVEFSLTLSLREKDGAEVRIRRVNNTVALWPAFVRPTTNESTAMITRLQNVLDTCEVQYTNHAREGTRNLGVSHDEIMDLLRHGSVVEHHAWDEEPYCVVLTKNTMGRRFLVDCRYPPAKNVIITGIAEPSRNNPLTAQYAEH